MRERERVSETETTDRRLFSLRIASRSDNGRCVFPAMPRAVRKSEADVCVCVIKREHERGLVDTVAPNKENEGKTTTKRKNVVLDTAGQ